MFLLLQKDELKRTIKKKISSSVSVGKIELFVVVIMGKLFEFSLLFRWTYWKIGGLGELQIFGIFGM